MEFEVQNQPVFTTLTVHLRQGESFKAEAGAMVSMSPTVELETRSQAKGIGGLFRAAVGGESVFASEFTATGGDGEVVLAPPAPGDIIRFDLSGQTLYCQGGAYLAGAPGLELSTQGSFKALFAGEGLFLQTVSGSGPVFLSCYGAVWKKQLGPGETYVVDTGHMVAFEEGMDYRIRKVNKGFFSSFASGEGLVSDFRGPGALYLQSRNLQGFAQLLNKLMPSRSTSD